MAREDIVAGLKNAIERGYSLEQAKHSFISAGYSKEEVEEASNFIHSGSILVKEKEESRIQRIAKSVRPAKLTSSAKPEMLENPKIEQKTPKAKKDLKIRLFIIILIVLIVALILFLLFKGKILEWFA